MVTSAALPFLPVKDTMICLDAFYLVPARTFPIQDGFSILQVELFMELMVGEREHLSAAPDLPGQNKPFVLEWPGHHCLPLGIEKAAISFEDEDNAQHFHWESRSQLPSRNRAFAP